MPEGALCWMRYVDALTSSISKENKDPLIFALSIPI